MRYFFFLLILLTSCSSVELDKEYLKKNYSTKELEYFGEVGFYTGNSVKKWQKNITISLVGTPKQGDIALVDSIIKEVMPLVAPIRIERKDSDGNLKIKLVDRVDKGYANQHVKLGFFNEFQYSDINLPNNLKGTLRQATLRHEFLHALGLHHPIEKGTGTLIESNVEFVDFDMENVKNYRFSELDKRMIKMLYDKNIIKGLKKKDYLQTLGLKEKLHPTHGILSTRQ
ncbi:hypothetical protein [uncultured Acetobacteroides sp.]|uniref:hypothetical protein n=1 Tax=uncultured Acetobacteroides sp. TaxID=1760811 RepID=UPI0029F4E195|nr:hypothetical protein [uncultured Acetobacteroides sp.]